jgi:hypothetical protein
LIDGFNDVNVKSDEGLLTSDPFEPHQGNLDARLDWTAGRRGIPFLDWGVHPGRFWIRDQSYAGPFSAKKQIVSKAESGKSGNQRLSDDNRLEFAMEGHRIFDLVRWGISEQVLNQYLDKERLLRTYLSGATFEEKHRYFPIPEQAIVYSSKDGKPTLQQNPGY